MNDFKDWGEVKDWLTEDWNLVLVDPRTFSKSSMSCNSGDDEYGPCCSDDYCSVELAVEAIKDFANNDISKVEKL